MDFNYYVNYFAYLEKRLIDTQKYVAFEKENLRTYSLEYFSIINDCCGIINGFCYELCKEEKPDIAKFEFDDYVDYFTKHQYNLDWKIYFDKFIIHPWKKLKSSNSVKTPQWWIDYNTLKHSGKPNFQRAHLKNAISCMAGLYALLEYYNYLLELKNIDNLNYCSVEISELFSHVFGDCSVSWNC